MQNRFDQLSRASDQFCLALQSIDLEPLKDNKTDFIKHMESVRLFINQIGFMEKMNIPHEKRISTYKRIDAEMESINSFMSRMEKNI